MKKEKYTLEWFLLNGQIFLGEQRECYFCAVFQPYDVKIGRIIVRSHRGTKHLLALLEATLRQVFRIDTKSEATVRAKEVDTIHPYGIGLTSMDDIDRMVHICNFLLYRAANGIVAVGKQSELPVEAITPGTYKRVARGRSVIEALERANEVQPVLMPSVPEPLVDSA